ncbi:MAG TPA: hypothetical protein VNB90_16040 [Cytophagaceae bacterium]|nr:hypothetical protein [Cytophagaceae bacterium]
MHYHISYTNPLTHLVDIEISLPATNSISTILQLPAWRPGRYELQNYAANIKHFSASDQAGNSFSFSKITRNQWKIDHPANTLLKVRYQYYAYQMDAGGCWLDELQLYLNFICCLMYEPSRINEPCAVTLALPAEYQIACGLPKEEHQLKAENFYHLADSPMIASAGLTHFSFAVEDIPFHIWIQGTNFVKEEKLLEDFSKYTTEQIRTMGDFPEKEYHYLFQFLPYRHYHGVEHRNSTVITLGPSEAIPEKGYADLVGISSHELFHAWNILKIRPAEMFPYDFTKENYFTTGFVAEGFTTYYGDLFLARAGVFSTEEYFAELNTSFKRHFEHFGNENLSLAESSQDLWVDGYVAGIPDRKVSIYVKGCIAALILDLEIRSKTNSAQSLDDLMRLLWNNYGKTKTGYTMESIIRDTATIACSDMTDFFQECIFGHTDLKIRLETALASIGCKLVEKPAGSITEKEFGFRTQVRGNRTIVEAIAPGSPASHVLSKDDEILTMDEIPSSGNIDQLLLRLSINRWGRVLEVEMTGEKEKRYYPSYTIEKDPHASEQVQKAFEQWLQKAF